MSEGAGDEELIALLRENLAGTAEISDLTEQMMEVAAIVDAALESLDIHPIVVGGLAVAYWTSPDYLTSDIDVVMPYAPEVERRLDRLGFTKDGRFWTLPGREVFFEAPGSVLEPKADGYEVVELRSGRTVRVQSAEEVLLGRLSEFVGTGHSDAFHQSLWLLGASGIDRKRLEGRAQEEHLGEALKTLDHYAEKVRTGEDLPPSWELKEIAKRLVRP